MVPPGQTVHILFIYICCLFFYTANSNLNKTQIAGHRLAELVASMTHVQRLCSGPGFDSRPGVPLLHATPPLLPRFLSHSSAVLSIKPEKAKKITLKKKNLLWP